MSAYIIQPSNHSPNVIKELLRPTENRFLNHFSDKKYLKNHESLIYHADTLNKLGYLHKLVYNSPSTSNHNNKTTNCQKIV